MWRIIVVGMGMVAGIAVILRGSWTLPVALSPYIAVAILAGLDSVIGALRSHVEGQYDERIFVSGFFTNSLLAVLLGYGGDLLGVNLVLAAEVAFGIRIFHNLGRIRRGLLRRWEQRLAPPSKPSEEDLPEGPGTPTATPESAAESSSKREGKPEEG